MFVLNASYALRRPTDPAVSSTTHLCETCPASCGSLATRRVRHADLVNFPHHQSREKRPSAGSPAATGVDSYWCCGAHFHIAICATAYSGGMGTQWWRRLAHQPLVITTGQNRIDHFLIVVQLDSLVVIHPRHRAALVQQRLHVGQVRLDRVAFFLVDELVTPSRLYLLAHGRNQAGEVVLVIGLYEDFRLVSVNLARLQQPRRYNCTHQSGLQFLPHPPWIRPCPGGEPPTPDLPATDARSVAEHFQRRSSY